MHINSLLFLVSVVRVSVVFSAPSQSHFEVPATPSNVRKLTGRFLHITDMHPDPYYTPYTSIYKSCHRKKPKKKKDRAGYYGTPFEECDSPLRLTNFTLDFLDKHWSSDIDFVIWTGDNARHDEDNKLPRTPDEIYDLNRAMASKMEKIFLKKGIPVIPSIGNNDVWPHNIMLPGPNSITGEYSTIWKSFIPFPSYQVFQRGAYFSVEVIPDALAVISLNTMYFYDSNKAVGGCEYKDPGDAGNLEFDWLEVQLEMFRSRDMKVWLSGHVPPSYGTYFPECYVRYVELSLRFQDTILGHLYGHRNADYFYFLDADDLELYTDIKSSRNKGLFEGIIDNFQSLPNTKKKADLDNYGVINVSPSVVPNPYLPTFRIFTYNITGANSAVGTLSCDERARALKDRVPKHPHGGGGKAGDKKKLCKEKEHKGSWKCKLHEPWHSDDKAPSRMNTLWSPLGYAQYYLPDLTSADKTHKPKYKLEYLTFRPTALHPQNNETEFQYPVPLRNLPRSLRNHTIKKSKYTPYRMDDLTIPSWIKLARTLAEPTEKKLRRRFKKYMFMGGKEG